MKKIPLTLLLFCSLFSNSVVSFAQVSDRWTALATPTTFDVFVVNPVDTNLIYAGFYDGVSKSVDGGKTWTNIRFLNSDETSALIINPLYRDTLYAGVQAIGTGGQGVYRSTNRGNTWTNVFSSNSVACLDFDWQRPHIIYAGTVTNQWWGPGVGLLRSSNGGNTWSQINNGLGNLEIAAIVLDVTDGNNLYVGTGSGVYKSTNAGQSWNAANVGLPGGVVVLSMAINPQDPNTLYLGTQGDGLYKSTNAAGSWSASGSGITSLTITSLLVNPLKPQFVYAGTESGGLSRSSDAGSSWSAVNGNGLGPFGYGSVGQIGVNPLDPHIVYAIIDKNTTACDIYVRRDDLTVVTAPSVTTNVASSVTSATATLNGAINPNGASTTTWFEWGTSSTLSSSTSTTPQSIGSGTSAITVSANLGGWTPSTTYYYRAVGQNSAGTQRGSIMSLTTSSAAPAWSAQSSGVSVYLYSVKAVNANVVWACGDKGTILRTLDGGTTWTQTSPVVSSLGCYNVEALDANTAWVIALNSTLPISVLYKTTNGGSTWTQQLTSSDPTTFYDAVRFYDANNGILLGDPEGGYFTIYTTTNGGNSWSRTSSSSIPTPLSLEYGLTNNLAISGTNAWFSTVNNSGGTPRVLRSTDRGKTWIVSTSVSVSSLGNELSTIALASDSVGLVQGINGNMIRTTTAGRTWSATIITGATVSGSVDFSTPTSAVFLGSRGQSGVSLDAGLTWSARTTADTTTIYRMSFSSSADGWAVGNRGTIWRWVGGVLPGPPWVITTSATNIGATSATLHGLVTPNSTATTAQFDWGTTVALLNSPISVGVVGSGSSALPIQGTLTSLSPNTTYYVRGSAQNTSGTTKGSIMSFTTLPLAGDPYEPNNTSAKATSIAYNFKTSGAELAPAGDVDYYKFAATSGDFVSIEVVTDPTADLNVRVSLFDPTGVELANSDIVYSGTERILYGINKTQTYYIRIVDVADTASFPNGVGPSGLRKSPSLAKMGASLQKKASVLQTGPYTLTLTPGAPAPPQILSAGSGFDGLVPLRWFAPQSNAPWEYRIYRSTTATGPFSLVGSTGFENFIDLTALNGVPYYYTVKSVYPATNAESQGSNIDKATPRANGHTITSKYAYIKPTLDGKHRLGEWADAQVQDITVPRVLNPSASVTMYVKNDDQTLYLAVDDSNASQSTYNFLWIGFDRDQNKTWDPSAPSREGYISVDDSAGVPIVRFYGLSQDYPNVHFEDGVRDPKGVNVKFSYGPKSLQYEITMDLGAALPTSLSQSGIGLYVVVYSDNLNGESPPGGLLVAPMTYTQVTFSKANIAKLPGEYAVDPGSVILLHLNESTGQFAIDATGNGNNGVVTGTTVVDGRFGKARNFNGTSSDAMRVKHATSLNLGSGFTIECWVKVLGAPQDFQTILRKTGLGGENYGLFVGPTASGTIRFQFSQGDVGTNMRYVDSYFGIADRKWHHVAGIYSGSEMKIYIDGTLAGSRAQSGLPDTNADSLVIGYSANGYYFNGVLDEIRISNRARLPNEFNLQLPPRNLTASPAGQSINLSWQNGGGLVPLLRYRIFRGLDSTNVSLIDSTVNTAYSNTGVTAGTKYFYRVAAVDSTGFESARTGAAIAATGAVSAPSLASPVDGAPNQPTTVTLSWVGSTGAINYRLQVSSNNNFTALTFDDSTIVGTSAQVKSLLNGTTYYWRVSAKTAAGTSGYSAVWSFTTVVAAPSQPTLASPANGATNQSLSLNLSWNPVAGATAYRCQLATSNTFATPIVDDSTISSTSRSVSSLTNNTTYYWRVSAKNAGGSSAFSSTYSFVTIASVPTAPTLTTPLNSATGLTSSVTLAWSSVVGATSYHVQVSTSAAYSAPLVLEDTSVATNSRQLNSLAANTTYYWRVRAKNVAGASAWPSSFTFSTAGTRTVTSPGVSYPSSPSASTDYRLVSFPGTSSLTVGQVLTGAQNTDWRIFRDNGATEPSNLTELASSSSLSPGEGYWLLTKGTFNFSNTLTMPQLAADGSYTITVRNGWNIIGNPFDLPVTWSVVKSDNASTANLWTYSGTGGYQSSTTLDPFKGYYFSSSSTTLKIRYPFPSSNVISAPPPVIDWKLQIALETEGNNDSENYIGEAPTAKESLDNLDQPKPPRFQDQASLSLSMSAPNGGQQLMSSDFRPSSQEGQLWNFSIFNPKQGKGILRFIGIEGVPAGFDVILIDMQNSVPIDIRQKHEVPITGSSHLLKFSLIVGGKNFVQSQEAQLIPKEFELAQNYPNPFNPSTTITYRIPRESSVRLEIVSLLGQHVETLASGVHTPGTYSVSWAPGDRRTSSGVYFVRLLVDGKVMQTQKMTLLK